MVYSDIDAGLRAVYERQATLVADRRVSIRAILPTQIITMLLGVLAMLIDGVMINIYLGDAAQAAYGLTNPMTLLINAYGGMISAGAQILVGRNAGHGNRDGDITKIYSTTTIAVMAGACAIALPNVIFSKQISFLLGAVNDEMAELTASYLRVVVLSYPIMVLAFTMPVFMQFYGKKIHIVIMAVILIIADILFNYISIRYANGGIQGIATASVLSYLAAFIYILIVMLRLPQLRVRFRCFCFKTFALMLKYGTVYLVYKLCTAVMSLAVNRILAGYGSVDYLAANSILLSLMLVTGAFSSGIGSTTTMISSYHVGRGDQAAMNAFLRRIHVVSLVMNALITLLCFVYAENIVSMFRPQSLTMFDCAVRAVCLYSGALMFHSANHIYRNYYLSIDRKKMAYLVCSLDNLILPLIAAVVIERLFNVENIWLCYPVGQALAALTSFLVHRFGKKTQISGLEKQSV